MVGMLECACAPTHLYARVSVGPHRQCAHTHRPAPRPHADIVEAVSPAPGLDASTRELATTVYATYWTTAYSGPQLRIRMQLVRLKSRYVKAVGVSAYCVLRITSWRAVLKAACGRPAYSAPVLRIELWAVVSAACVLRTAYSYRVLKLCDGLRTAYCVSVLRIETVWGVLRTA